jgi:hypothetical protein
MTMTEYEVCVRVEGYVYLDVEADSPQEAEEVARQKWQYEDLQNVGVQDVTITDERELAS